MTETDSTKRPLQMPPKFLPYLEKTRVYQMMKDMVKNIIISMPKDHLKQMKIFLGRHMYASESSRIVMLIEPGLTFDVHYLAQQMIKDFGCFIITRRCVMDRYEKHDDYVPGCVSTVLMSTVTKILVEKEPVPQAGWLMFDHPCTVREARCMQQDGILPSVTLVVMKTPPVASHAADNHTTARNFFQQDFEGLKYAYKATLKEVHINPEDSIEVITTKCFNAVRANAMGAQGPKQGIHAIGAPGVYRVLLIGPRCSGRKSQAYALAKHFGMVYLNFDAVFNEAAMKNDDTGVRIRKYGTSIQLRAEVIEKRILRKDCIDNGWVLTGYPMSGVDFERLDSTPTPPNRVMFLNVDTETCRKRAMDLGYNFCTGKKVPFGSIPGVTRHPDHDEAQMENEWDIYFTEALAELRAAAGITAVEIDGTQPFDTIQVKLQAATMAAPLFDIESCSLKLRSACAD